MVERPFADKRPIGPFLEPLKKDFKRTELITILQLLKEEAEDDADLVENIIEGEGDRKPLRETDNVRVNKRVLSAIRNERSDIDSATQKIAGKLELRNTRRGVPDMFEEYKQAATRRDEALDRMKEILDEISD